ncbi:MAG: DNA repair protein RadC [Bacteroidota bacterium]
MYKEHFPLSQWAESDRPREKLLSRGQRGLTDAELLAILLGSGSKGESAVSLARRMLSGSENNLKAFARRSVVDLMTYNGVGVAKAVTITAAMELGRRWQNADTLPKQVIQSSRAVFELMGSKLGDLPVEEFWVLLLNRGNRLNTLSLLSRGGITGTVVDIRMIIKMALDHFATSIILCHNHPSGNLMPSENDLVITRKIKKACALFDIAVLDHLIIAETDYFSFADEGKL